MTPCIHCARDFVNAPTNNDLYSAQALWHLQHGYKVIPDDDCNAYLMALQLGIAQWEHDWSTRNSR